MKKFIISVAVLLASLSATVSCSFFQLDSFEGPNAEVTGNLIDMVTGEKMSIEAAQSQGFDWSTWPWRPHRHCGAEWLRQDDAFALDSW